MCTVVLKRDFGKPKIAESDIKVYKVTSSRFNTMYDSDDFISPNRFRTPFQGFLYLADVCYVTEMEVTSDNTASDSVEGNYSISLPSDSIVYIGEGFHSYLTLERVKNSGLTLKGLFIIPKGAEYYTNECGNAVSNKLIFKRYIKQLISVL
jgi:hypothetical protein